MKKIISMLLSVALASTMFTTVFAAKNENKLTTNPAVELTYECVGVNDLGADGIEAVFGLKLASSAFSPMSVIPGTRTNPETYKGTGINAGQFGFTFAEGVLAEGNVAWCYDEDGTNAATRGANGNTNYVESSLTLIRNFALGVGKTTTPAFYTAAAGDEYETTHGLILSEDFLGEFSGTPTVAQINEKMASGEIGKVTTADFMLETLDDNGTATNTIVHNTTVGLNEPDCDYLFKSVWPPLEEKTPEEESKEVPVYGTKDEIANKKAGTYDAAPESGDTGKGLYWLIKFTQTDTDAYITATIDKYSLATPPVFEKQKTVAIQLDNGTNDKFRGEGNRAAYIFVENVPSGKYKATFRIGETVKFADGYDLFADDDYITVE